MVIELAIVSAVCIGTAGLVDRGKRNGFLRNALILILSTIGMTSCSAVVVSLAGCEPTQFQCVSDYDSRGAYADCQ